MKIWVSMKMDRQRALTLPDDLEITKSFWLDVQQAMIDELQDLQAKGEVCDRFLGIDGDFLFRQKMDAYIRETEKHHGRPPEG